MIKKHGQLINTILIIIGGELLIYSIMSDGDNKYFQIGGLIIIMFGLYRATTFWVENKDIDDDTKKDENS